MTVAAELPSRFAAALKRAFSQFLALPLAVVIAFVLMAAAFYVADTAWSGSRAPAGFAWLGELLGDSHSLATLLSTVASSIITVTSITFSLLLIALQQGSSALTTQVTDQFLMRRMNQFYFGFFVGLSVFVLISLVTASSIHRPVFGTTLALLLTAIALCMIVVMIYNTIDQMRPKQIVRAIHRHVLVARERQSALLRQTRRMPREGWIVVATVRSQRSGYIVDLDVAGLKASLAALGGAELQLLVPIGRYLAHREPLALVRMPEAPGNLSGVDGKVHAALGFDDDRSLTSDAAYGISQLSDIGWTSVSTAKSNPNPGTSVIESLRDILSRWADEGEILGDPSSPVVIADAAPEAAIDAIENLVLVASESIQASTLASAFRTIAMLLAVVPQPWAVRLADVTRRALSSLGEHVLTRDLEDALDRLGQALEARGFDGEAHALRAATRTFSTTLGILNSRSTRVPGSA